MFKQKEATKLELCCPNCGKPIAGKPRTNVTRYLFKQSRCQCLKPDVFINEGSDGDNLLQALPNNANEIGNKQIDQVREISPEASALSNLPDYYQVLSLIGEGGMGTVYKVLDTRLDKVFAVKVLRPQLVADKNALERFKQESQAASSLNHANLAAVYTYDVGKHGAPYIVMDYCEGENLAEVLKHGKCIDVPSAIDLFIEIAEALEHAHEKGVIHRDIKPTNIIIEQRNGTKIPKLVDFGIAKILPREGVNTQGLTQTGDIFGSPLYMSPEQCLGNELDARSDIYTMGCVMYECLCGKPPFSGGNPIKTILKHINDKPAELGKVSTQQKVPDDLQYIIMRCLEKQSENRYQTMSALKNDLMLLSEHKPLKRVKSTNNEKSNSFKQIVLPVLAMVVFLYVIAGPLLKSFIMDPALAPGDIVSHDPGAVAIPSTGLVNPDSDAIKLDSLSYSYFNAGQYDKAIPLLEFGVKAFRESGKRDSYLADQLQHIGKCYKMLGKYDKAAPYYDEAVTIYSKWGNYKGSLVPECIRDYAEVLRKLNRADEANRLEDNWNIR